MRYIRKTQPHPDLIEFINTERTVRGIYNPRYNSLQTINPANPAYTSLRQQLYDEQKGLCCYCMKVITVANSRIEHFLPQSLFLESEVDYYNLYLACNSSKGLPKAQQHCDIGKGNFLIAKFIGYCDSQAQRCEDLVKYTPDGYILPAFSPYNSLSQFYLNYQRLPATDKVMLATIDVLNLNTEDLRIERVNFIKALTPILQRAQNDPLKLKAMKRDFEDGRSKKFAGIAIYLVNQKLAKLS